MKMNDESSFRYNWNNMSIPPNEEKITIKKVNTTNAYLTKSHDNTIGLFLEDIVDKIPKRTYKHLEIKMNLRKEINIKNSEKKIIRNCMHLIADSEINASVLSLILESLLENQPSGQFTAMDLITVLDDVEELLRRPKKPPTIEEVVGVWGELYILRLLIGDINNVEIQEKIIAGWEGEIREKLDFRFRSSGHVLEIKTTISNQRIHHIHGIEQVTLPPGFNSGVMASLVLETNQGSSCLMLVNSIKDCFKGSEIEKQRLLQLFNKRMRIRGIECKDERFIFDLSFDGLKFYKLGNVPKPGNVDGVTAIEWLSDLRNIDPLNTTETDNLLSEIISLNSRN